MLTMRIGNSTVTEERPHPDIAASSGEIVTFHDWQTPRPSSPNTVAGTSRQDGTGPGRTAVIFSRPS